MNFKIISDNDKRVTAKGELRLLGERADNAQQKVELWLLNDEVNRNNWRYVNLEQHKDLFAETPILIAYVGDKIGDGHNFEQVRKPDGTVAASFMDATAERIVGYFKSTSDIRIEVKNGKKWIVGVGVLWSWYAMELVDKLKKQGVEGMSISIETLVKEMYYEGSTEVYTKYQILGTTILGDDVAPAVADASIRALSQLGVQEVRELTLRVASQYTSDNPQKTNSKQGETKPMLKLKDLDGKFVGFKPIAVNGQGVALLSQNTNELFYATASKENGEVIEGAKVAVNANVTLGEGDNAVTVAVDTLMEASNSRINTLQAELDKKNSDLETVSNALKAMQAQETARRKEAIINAVKARLAKNRENNPDADIAENACDDLMTDECVAEYVERVDKDGKFIGDKEIVKEVDSRCMEAINNANAARLNKARSFKSWTELMANNSVASGEDKEQAQMNSALENVLR